MGNTTQKFLKSLGYNAKDIDFSIIKKIINAYIQTAKQHPNSDFAKKELKFWNTLLRQPNKDTIKAKVIWRLTKDLGGVNLNLNSPKQIITPLQKILTKKFTIEKKEPNVKKEKFKLKQNKLKGLAVINYDEEKYKRAKEKRNANILKKATE